MSQNQILPLPGLPNLPTDCCNCILSLYMNKCLKGHDSYCSYTSNCKFNFTIAAMQLHLIRTWKLVKIKAFACHMDILPKTSFQSDIFWIFWSAVSTCLISFPSVEIILVAKPYILSAILMVLLLTNLVGFFSRRKLAALSFKVAYFDGLRLMTCHADWLIPHSK